MLQIHAKPQQTCAAKGQQRKGLGSAQGAPKMLDHDDKSMK
jgi:hypothetical protein